MNMGYAFPLMSCACPCGLCLPLWVAPAPPVGHATYPAYGLSRACLYARPYQVLLYFLTRTSCLTAGD